MSGRHFISYERVVNPTALPQVVSLLIPQLWMRKRLNLPPLFKNVSFSHLDETTSSVIGDTRDTVVKKSKQLMDTEPVHGRPNLLSRNSSIPSPIRRLTLKLEKLYE